MKIENSLNSFPPSSASDAPARTAQAKTAESQTPPEGVNVRLGSASSQLRSMEVDVANASAVDSKKVAEIKQAISEGRFQINSAAIADGLINDVEELINASQSDR